MAKVLPYRNEHKWVGILTAEELEENPFRDTMDLKDERVIAGITFREGSLGGTPVVLARCGVGKVNAAMCAQAMIDMYTPRAVVMAGVAGGLHREVRIGDLVVSSHVVQYDFDLTAFRRQLGEVPLVREMLIRDPVMPGLSGQELGPGSFSTTSAVQLVRADVGLRGALERAYDSLLSRTAISCKLHAGVVATGDRFVSRNDRYYAEHLRLLRVVFGALCVEMEGAAVGYACMSNSVPFVVLRGICDHADGGAVEDFKQNLSRAADSVAQVLVHSLGEVESGK